MSTKCFCDACGKSNNQMNSFSFLCHIDDIVTKNYATYSDNDGNPVSGRSVEVDLCNECYNRVVVEAVKKLYELKTKNAL
jgi:hypothetical protein